MIIACICVSCMCIIVLTACLENAALPLQNSCDPLTGCACQEGYMRPDCCECDIFGLLHSGKVYYRRGEKCLSK